MSDILNKIVAVKHEEIAQASKTQIFGRSFGPMPKAACSPVISSGPCAPRSAAGQAGCDRRDQKGQPFKGRVAG
jgi:hypothetical protein